MLCQDRNPYFWIADVKQDPDESFSAFLDVLNTCQLSSPIDPENLANKAIILAFVAQSVPDMHRKMQKMDGFAGKNRSKLLEIALKMFDSKDSPLWLHDKPQPF